MGKNSVIGALLAVILVLQAVSVFQQMEQNRVVGQMAGIAAALDDGDMEDRGFGRWERHKVGWSTGDSIQDGVFEPRKHTETDEETETSNRFLRIGHGDTVHGGPRDGGAKLGRGQTFVCGNQSFCKVTFRARFTAADGEVARVRLKGKRGPWGRDVAYLRADIPASGDWVTYTVWIEGCEKVTIVFSIDGGQTAHLQATLDIDDVAATCENNQPNTQQHGTLGNPDTTSWTTDSP